MDKHMQNLKVEKLISVLFYYEGKCLRFFFFRRRFEQGLVLVPMKEFTELTSRLASQRGTENPLLEDLIDATEDAFLVVNYDNQFLIRMNYTAWEILMRFALDVRVENLEVFDDVLMDKNDIIWNAVN